MGYAGDSRTDSGGTIFLDEIGDMPLALQAKILRVLQEKEFERVGDNQPISTDVRILAATNRDLKEAARKDIFNKEFFNAFEIRPA